MTLQQIVDLAADAELKQLSVKNSNSVIIGYVNLAMIELYKRFPLKVEEHIVTITENQLVYDMPTNFMWLVAAYGEVAENDYINTKTLPINEEDNELSINTINWRQVQIPSPDIGSNISLIYVAAPTILAEDNLEDEVELPPQMLEALLHYVGYRGHAALNGEINAENSTHYTRFEKSCAMIKSEGMFTGDDVRMSNRIVDKGFV